MWRQFSKGCASTLTNRVSLNIFISIKKRHNQRGPRNTDYLMLLSRTHCLFIGWHDSRILNKRLALLSRMHSACNAEQAFSRMYLHFWFNNNLLCLRFNCGHTGCLLTRANHRDFLFLISCNNLSLKTCCFYKLLSFSLFLLILSRRWRLSHTIEI